jgi:phosphoribosylformimino-5-aminoimidazole carboxamide ribotide isomerase
VKKFPNKIALGLDAKDSYLSVSGWKENSNKSTLDYLKGLMNMVQVD